ncbi:hypothetical protein Tco_0646508 [Tanacetum coccineum]
MKKSQGRSGMVCEWCATCVGEDDWRLPMWQLGRDKVGKGVGRHRGYERGMMLVCYLAGSGDRTLKKMYSVPEFYFEVWEMSRIVPEGTGYSLKDKNKAKYDKTESGIGKSAKY